MSGRIDKTPNLQAGKERAFNSAEPCPGVRNFVNGKLLPLGRHTDGS